MYDLAIIGGGPAGISAGIYAKRGGLENVAIFDGSMLGGQITKSSEMENYPGVKETMDGYSFMLPWVEQSNKFGTKHVMKNVTKISKNDNVFLLKLEDGTQEKAKSVIVSTGSNPKLSGIKGEDKFFGKGVGTCANCDAFFYKGKEVAVLGGGDSALEEAIHLAHICSKVTIIHRRSSFKASPLTIQRAKNLDNIELKMSANLEEICGDDKGLTHLIVDGTPLHVSGLFIYVGIEPNSAMLKDGDKYICKDDGTGHIVADMQMRTDLAGLYVAGDIRANSPKQVVCAASDGAIAGMQALEFLRD